jgi:AraC family transcriptional regulator
MLSRVVNLTSQSERLPGAIVAGLGDIAGSGDVHMPARGGLSPRTFQRVREYILAHLPENISNGALAELAGLSVYHFTRAFKQSAGVPPRRFIIASRVERVKHLLAETELPLALVAITVGFNDQSHFTHMFRELVGITPRRFRRLQR